jgi:hypothetical protein
MPPWPLGSSELLPCYVHAADIAASMLATIHQPHLQLAGDREALRSLGFNEEQFSHFIARTQNLVWQTPLLRAA